MQKAILYDNFNLIFELLPHTKLNDENNCMQELSIFALDKIPVVSSSEDNPKEEKHAVQLLKKLIIEGLDFKRYLKFGTAKELAETIPYKPLLVEAEKTLVRYANPTTKDGEDIKRLFYDVHQDCVKTVAGAAFIYNKPELVEQFKVSEGGNPKEISCVYRATALCKRPY